MQKLKFHNDKGDTEAFEKVTSEEPKEWTAVEFHKGAQEYVQENGEFEYEEPQPKEEVDWSAREAELEEAINDDFDRTYAERRSVLQTLVVLADRRSAFGGTDHRHPVQNRTYARPVPR